METKSELQRQIDALQERLNEPKFTKFPVKIKSTPKLVELLNRHTTMLHGSVESLTLVSINHQYGHYNARVASNKFSIEFPIQIPFQADEHFEEYESSEKEQTVNARFIFKEPHNPGILNEKWVDPLKDAKAKLPKFTKFPVKVKATEALLKKILSHMLDRMDTSGGYITLIGMHPNIPNSYAVEDTGPSETPWPLKAVELDPLLEEYTETVKPNAVIDADYFTKMTNCCQEILEDLSLKATESDTRVKNKNGEEYALLDVIGSIKTDSTKTDKQLNKENHILIAYFILERLDSLELL